MDDTDSPFDPNQPVIPVVVDLTAQPGDVRYACLKCGWSVTLKPEGEALWTRHSAVIPTCRRDKVLLIRTVVL
jgi:hypothetical protein